MTENAREDVHHYTTGGIETIDYMVAKLGPEGAMFFIIGNLIKYSSRALHKDQLKSDLTKIRNYANMALEIIDKHYTKGIE